MDRRSIALKSISCRGVKSFNLFQKPSTYVVVSIDAGNDDDRKKRKQLKQKTAVDNEGGENPEWYQMIQFDLDDREFQNRFLEFAIMAQGNLVLFGDKLIGKSRVPMTDLYVGHPSDVIRHVSYQVRSTEGKPNGVLSFSYSLKTPKMEIRIPPPLEPGIPPALPMDDYIPPPAPPLDDYIPPSAPPMGDYIPPPAPPMNNLYPPLPLPEAEQEDSLCYCNQPPPPDPPKYYPQPPAEAEPGDCFCYCSQPPPPDPLKYYTPPPLPDSPKYYPPPPPPPPAAGYYPAFDRAVSSPVLSRDAYFSTPAIASGGYYTPAVPSLPPTMPAFATYYPSSAPAYIYPPPPQNSSRYWNCN